MPRIPVRTTPYHTLPRCTRHYKSKRDLILRALGKASFINGSQFVITWISPKGEVDVYASELLQSSVSAKEGGVLDRKEIEREAVRVRGEMGRRWEDIRRLEEKGEAPVLEDADEPEAVEVDEDDDANMDEDADRTLVDEPWESLQSTKSMPSSSASSSLAKTPAATMMSTFPTATRSSTPASPMHTLKLSPWGLDSYYESKFAALQQATCKLVVKAWIKVIEPKKQMKYPYNKGEELKPAWWPEGVRHREPDHLSKSERLTLLTSIVRSPLVTVSRLELSTAEAAAFISRPRLDILREVYLVAKEEEKREKEEDTDSDLVVQLPNVPLSPPPVSPELPAKRSRVQVEHTAQENTIVAPVAVYATAHQSKRAKLNAHASRLAPLTTSIASPNYYEQHPQPYAYATGWPQGMTPAHLSPYPQEFYPSSEYGRSPNPDQMGRTHSPYGMPPAPQPHLAPLLNQPHSHHPSPIHSPFPQTPSMTSSSTQPHTAGSSLNPASAYFDGPRSASAMSGASPAPPSYMQQQQMDYLQAHGHGYDYGSPYIAEGSWEQGGFSQSA